MLTIIFGILSSLATEIVTAINAKLQNTVLKGDGAFFLAIALAFPAAIVKEIVTPGFSWDMLLNVQQIGTNFGLIFGISQVYFYLIAQKLNLDIPSPAAQSSGV